MKSSSIFITILACLSTVACAADTQAWKSRNIYFALTDRIARGSEDNGGDSCGNLGNYCGGTFAGLESKLDYIKGMGFDAIWITPVVSNKPGGYHGYWAEDLYSINSNYGTADDLKSLVNAAHGKNMFVMADVVANHMGAGNMGSNRPEPLNSNSAYHQQCDIDYNNQESVEDCWIAGLPDIRTEDAEIRSVLNTWISWLVNEYQFDGLRIDTAKHVEREFWSGFSSAAGVYTVGEVWEGDPDYLRPYAEVMSGLLDYAVYYPLNRFYQQTGSSQDLVDMHNLIGDTFPDPAAMATFIDNHDNARWLSQRNDASLLKNALAYVILGRGIPIVYYGTEQGYAGGADPSNREDLWRSGFDQTTDLYQAISRMSAARSSAGGLGDTDHVHLYVEDTAYAWSRAGGDVVVLTTNSGSGFNGEHCFSSQRPNGSWTDVMGDADYSADGDGRVCVQVRNGQPVILVAK